MNEPFAIEYFPGGTFQAVTDTCSGISVRDPARMHHGNLAVEFL